jgi:hypothetical protein
MMSDFSEDREHADAASMEPIVRRGVPCLKAAMDMVFDLKRFEDAMRKAYDRMDQFVYSIGRNRPELCYRTHHKRMPGSDRTSRLRKKRRTKIESFWRRHHVLMTRSWDQKYKDR